MTSRINIMKAASMTAFIFMQLFTKNLYFYEKYCYNILKDKDNDLIVSLSNKDKGAGFIYEGKLRNKKVQTHRRTPGQNQQATQTI